MTLPYSSALVWSLGRAATSVKSGIDEISQGYYFVHWAAVTWMVLVAKPQDSYFSLTSVLPLT